MFRFKILGILSKVQGFRFKIWVYFLRFRIELGCRGWGLGF